MNPFVDGFLCGALAMWAFVSVFNVASVWFILSRKEK